MCVVEEPLKRFFRLEDSLLQERMREHGETERKNHEDHLNVAVANP
jgi:hypothetical protein